MKEIGMHITAKVSDDGWVYNIDWQQDGQPTAEEIYQLLSTCLEKAREAVDAPDATMDCE